MRWVPQDLIPIVTSPFLRFLVNTCSLQKEGAFDYEGDLFEFGSFVFHNLKIFKK